jgi:hypothetical protein
MTRFALRALLFIAILITLMRVVTEVSKRYPENAAQRNHVEWIRMAFEEADSIEILLLGSSHVRYGIDTTLISGRSHVLGLFWNDVFEVEHQVRLLAPRMPRLHTAIITLSYTSFHWDNAVGDEEVFLDSRRIFYAEQRLGPWIRGDFRNYVLGKLYWLVRSDNWYQVVNGIRRAPDLGAGEPPQLDPDGLERHAEDRATRFVRGSAVMMETRSNLTDAATAAVGRTIRELQDRGVRVLLVTTPFYVGFNDRLHETPLPDEMRTLARRIADEHDVPWIDAGDSDFSNCGPLFIDSDHLNAEGRAVFTSWLLAQDDLAPRSEYALIRAPLADTTLAARTCPA